MKLLVITNICAHFRIKAFEQIGRTWPTRFVFFSDGGEDYLNSSNALATGDFNYRYLPGFYLAKKIRVTPSLISEIIHSKADAMIVGIVGRFSVPVSYIMARLMGKKFILWSGLWYHPQSFFHKVTWPLTKWLYNHSDAILVYGEHVKKYLVDLGIDANKIFLFWQSVDVEKLGRTVNLEKVSDYQKKWSPDGTPILLFVGRFEEVKGLDTLLQAFAQLKQSQKFSIVFVGKGEERAKLTEIARLLNLDVQWVDHIPNAELPEVYAAASVFCLPSRSMPTVKEAWGIVLNEAMLQRCVPVASDAVGAAVGGLFSNEMRELVFREDNVEEMVRSLNQAILFSKDPKFREHVRQHALFFNPKTQAEGIRPVLKYLGIKDEA